MTEAEANIDDVNIKNTRQAQKVLGSRGMTKQGICTMYYLRFMMDNNGVDRAQG
jgi:hypothetical protein